MTGLPSRVFKSNRSQAVRIPKALAFPDHVKDVILIRDGDRLIVAPRIMSWEEFFALPPIDFPERDQPPVQEREYYFDEDLAITDK